MQIGKGIEAVESGSEVEIESAVHDSVNQAKSMTEIVVDIRGNEGMIGTEHITHLTIGIEIHMTDAITSHPHPSGQMRLIVVYPVLLYEDDRFRLRPHTVPKQSRALTAVRHLPSECELDLNANQARDLNPHLEMFMSRLTPLVRLNHAP